MELPDWTPEQTLDELRVRYQALASNTDEELMVMMIATAAQFAHRAGIHPARALLASAREVGSIWGREWDELVHDALEER